MAATDNIPMLLEALAHGAEILRWAVAATVIHMALWLRMVVAVVVTIAVTVALWPLVLMLPRTVVVIPATLIALIGVQQWAGTDHQDSQPGNEGIWHFHG